jgi:GNAT superfamily N-acetyltransferase
MSSKSSPIKDSELQNAIVIRTTKDVNLTALQDLTAAVGWGRRGDKLWSEVLSRSSSVCSAWHQSQLIGFGRILEDGVMCMFYDIAVHPDFQGKGVGKTIMATLIEQVKDRGYVSIGLFGWEGNPTNVRFYESCGFESVHSGMELTCYMRREG